MSEFEYNTRNANLLPMDYGSSSDWARHLGATAAHKATQGVS